MIGWRTGDSTGDSKGDSTHDDRANFLKGANFLKCQLQVRLFSKNVPVVSFLKM
jgi:hypothetical protein